ncbi:hypothetical protein LCGC14_2575650 [marine sediment metagenome]|uniref:Uncharacterized protein n=1 Tax=marine sediment metagenome TaxID=412755 RepID=A0A0F9CS35_9ZZZZ
MKVLRPLLICLILLSTTITGCAAWEKGSTAVKEALPENPGGPHGTYSGHVIESGPQYQGYDRGADATVTFEGDTFTYWTAIRGKRVYTYEIQKRNKGLGMTEDQIVITDVLTGDGWIWSFTYDGEHDAILIDGIAFYK